MSTELQGITVSAAFSAIENDALTINGVKTFTSSPVVPTPTTDMQATTKKYVDDAFKAAYPIGALWISTVSTNPNTLLGFGTWAAFGAGKVMVGINAADEDFDVAEETGGEKTHTLTTDEIPAHTHKVATSGSLAAAGADRPTPSDAAVESGSAGGGGAHNNLQPYIVVYMFKRTA